jgi:hypothetical protein
MIGQVHESINNSGTYIVFAPVSESIQAPHINGTTIDGYAVEFCVDRNITFAAKIQAKTIDSLSLVISGLIAAVKVTNGPSTNISIQWDTQDSNTGITRQGEMVTINFDLLFPVPSMESFLVTPETFDSTVDFVDVLPDGYDYIINPNFEIPPFFATGTKNI